MTLAQRGSGDERERRIAAYTAAEAPVVARLRDAGYPVDHIQDLYKQRYQYRSAVPILVDALATVTALDVGETIVRALSVPYARGFARPLVEQFRRYEAAEPFDEGFQFKWAVGNALAVVADDSVYDEVVQLIGDPSHGRTREMLVVGLANMKTHDPDQLLIDLLDDPVLAAFAAIALGKRRTVGAVGKLRELVDHGQGRNRVEARKALRKIEGRTAPAEP